LALLRTTDLVRRHIAATLAPHGITAAQYNVLRILRGAGEGGLPTTEVGERLLEHSPGITRMMDRLEVRGWVTRERCTEDRRRVYCRISDRGLQLLSETDAAVDRADSEALRGLAEAEQKKLIGLLDKVRRPYVRD
jgi:DNA-binding MarR family transcriptional regulator